MLLRFLVVASMMLFTSGCSRWIELHVAPEDTSLVAIGDDGAVTLEEGETARFLLYGTHSGFETQGFACGSDDGLRSSDPAVLGLFPVGYRNVDVNSYDTDAAIWALSGTGAGDVVVHATCGSEERDLKVHVLPFAR